MGARVEWELFCSPQKGCSASSYSWHLAMHAKQNFVFFTLYIRLMQFFLFFLFFLINCRIFISVFNFSPGQKPFSLGECQINDRHFDHRILICTLWEKEIWKAKWNIDRRTYFDLMCYLPLCIAFDSRKAKILPTLLQHLNHAACLSEIFFSLFRNETAKQWENSVKIFTILGSIWGPNKNKKHFLWAALALTWP